MTPCQERGFHSFRPDADDNWACIDCSKAADRDPSEPCVTNLLLVPMEHRWIGHDAKGLLCQADATWNTAKRVHCACGASKLLEVLK